MDYEGQAAGVTSMRGPNNMNNDSGNDTAPTQVATNVGGKIIKSPTTAEVSQSSATDAAAYDNRKTKSKGRSMTIMTSSKGINRNNTLTLGKPSLLGR
jgi:methionine-rich copper-binding protein CopC